MGLFTAVDAYFHFTVDVCATPGNAKCGRYYTPDQDGLQQSWQGEVAWCNPPYGRSITAWVEKAAREARDWNTVVVCLVPARTDTRWWHDYAMRAWAIWLVKGRLTFEGAENPAPFPSALLVFRAGAHGAPVVRSFADHVVFDSLSGCMGDD
jgi:phage N-6-adenine-methyltransferase